MDEEPRVYTSVIACPCDWAREAAGEGVDASLLPQGSVATWYRLKKVHPDCTVHAWVWSENTHRWVRRTDP